MAVLGKAIIGSRDLIRNTAEAQRLSLFFEQIVIWSLDRTETVAPEDRLRAEQEIEYLREEKVVVTAGVNMTSLPFGFINEQGENTLAKDLNGKYDILLPFFALANHPEGDFEHEADRVVFGISQKINYLGTPLVAHVNPKAIAHNANPAETALQITLGNVPVPAGDMPWQDFVQFRKDPENVSKLRALRVWIQKIATNPEEPTVLQDQLEAMLDDYETYMKLQKVKYRRGVISSTISAGLQLATDVKLLNIGGALSKLLEIATHNIALSEAQLKAPGREVAFVSAARDMINKR